jgi:ankyrin repeat protein
MAPAVADMDSRTLSFRAPLPDYESQAERLLSAHRARDPESLEFVRRHHPRCRNEAVPWLPKEHSAEEISGVAFDRSDALLTIARSYDFADWQALAEWVGDCQQGEAVARFESAVEAVVDGDHAALAALLRQDPALTRARSTRRTAFDPPVHRATLLHYVAANGVESQRQRTPGNAVAIARTLLEAGAEVDALASFYSGECSTMSLLVSSDHPAAAGVQAELVELLLDHGAAIEGRGEKWGSPLKTALAFGHASAAQALVQRGARVDFTSAAGLGRADEVANLLAGASPAHRHLALALAAQLGHTNVVRLLLDAGEDPDRFNPEGAHAHTTPLHQAVFGGHSALVEMLVQRGARLDIKDRIYGGTPLDWALHAQRQELASYLRSCGAS